MMLNASDMNALIEGQMLLLPKLLAALPRCEDCGKPATRIGSDGGERDALCLCDSCRPELRLYEIETAQKELIDGMAEPEVRWAPALRQLRQLLEQPPPVTGEPVPAPETGEPLVARLARALDQLIRQCDIDEGEELAWLGEWRHVLPEEPTT